MSMHEARGWALIAHGGAKDIAPREEQDNRRGMEEAVRLGRDILQGGGAALDAVECVVKALEKNPTYNAGLFGSVLNEDGEIEMDASIMDGTTLDIGAVAGLQDVENPVAVARLLLTQKPILLIGEGANKFARKAGFLTPIEPPPLKKAAGCDTVGCVARDRSGALAVATSTGGLEGTMAGRVGDVPLPGCGFYADNRRGAVSASGEGEAIARVLLASEFLHQLEHNAIEDAARQALKRLERIGGEAGLIAIGPEGEIGWAHNSQHFAVGLAHENGAIRVYLQKSEET